MRLRNRIRDCNANPNYKLTSSFASITFSSSLSLLDFFSLRSDFDSGLLSLGFETLFSGPVIFSDFSLVGFSDDDFDLSVFVESLSFVAFLDGDFSETSETFFNFSARSDEAFSVFSDDFSLGLETGLEAFSDSLFDDFSDILSEVLSDDFTGVDDIGLFDSSGFDVFKIDFIVGLGFAGTTSTFSFSTVFDFTKLLSGFFGESDFSDLSDFLSAGFGPGSLVSDLGFSFWSVSFVGGVVFVGSGIGS